jgi:hypothetical protein
MFVHEEICKILTCISRSNACVFLQVSKIQGNNVEKDLVPRLLLTRIFPTFFPCGNLAVWTADRGKELFHEQRQFDLINLNTD